MNAALPYPKIELHVHLEATLQAARLLELARRNGVSPPADAVEAIRRTRDFSGFDHFIEAWIATSRLLRTGRDFRELVVDYAREVSRQGCVYLEGSFSPAEPVRRGASWQEVFEGYCDGAREARDLTGVEVRLTPEITRDFPVEQGEEVARWAVRFRERGVVALGLGGSEDRFPPGPFARAFAIAREGGLGSVPHAGEIAGAASVRETVETLSPDRLRHGVRTVEDESLLAEVAARGIVCDVTPVSNLFTGVVATLAEHPLPQMLAAGVACSISSDDPGLMDTDLERDCAAAVDLGHTPRDMFAAGVQGALCDAATKTRLAAMLDAYPW